jgi:hypothetical protein
MMDYRELLKKYINHVGDCEGTTFLGDHDRGDARDFEFTDEEWTELQKLDKEPLGLEYGVIDFNTVVMGTIEGGVQHTYAPQCPPGCYGQLMDCVYNKPPYVSEKE